jgi:hypothetical protein
VENVGPRQTAVATLAWRLLLPVPMRGVALAVLVAVSAGCANAYESPGSAGATAWLREREHQTVSVVPRWDPSHEAVRAPTYRGSLEPASSPLVLRLGPPADLSLPLDRVRQVTVVKRLRGTLEGSAIGLGTGVLLGAALALSDSRNGSMECTYPCSTGERLELYGGLLGLIGVLAGAGLGLAIGHLDTLLLW